MNAKKRRNYLIGFMLGFMASCPLSTGADNEQQRTGGHAPAHLALSNLPLSFEVNQGQSDAQVKFLSRGSGYSLFLTADEAVLVLNSLTDIQDRGNQSGASVKDNRRRTTDHPYVLRMHLVGANPSPQVMGLDELPGKSHYLTGNDPQKWHIQIPTFARVKYGEIYPGIDLIYYGNQQQLEYDFIVAPGADPGKIRLAFTGADDTQISPEGDLVLTFTNEHICLHKPHIYQEIDGVRQKIPGRYVRLEPSSQPREEDCPTPNCQPQTMFSFEIAAYDPGKPLIIDPVLSYFTTLTGSKNNVGNGIAVDAAGGIYVTGYTVSTDFSVGAIGGQPVQSSFGGGSSDAFIAKLNVVGTAIVYATYLGGNGTDIGNSIAVDTLGNAYITGSTTSTNFPVTTGALDTSCGTDGNCNSAGALSFPDAFVVKLNPTGTGLVYATYLGGSGDDEGFGIAVNTSGNAYVTGRTKSLDFTTVNPLQANNGGIQDAFVAKLNTAGSALVYSTYFGGSGSDAGFGIALDSSENVYLTGETESLNFPTLNPFQSALGGLPLISKDAFVAKLNGSGNTLLYSTYLGGRDTDKGLGIAVDNSGKVYVTGITSSMNFPVANPFQASYQGSQDAFVAKLDPSQSGGASLVYSTYLGGTATDEGFAIAVDAIGNAYITGDTGSNNFPLAIPFQPTISGGFDAFLTKLSAAGTTLLYSTFIGRGSNDRGLGVAVDTSGNAYVVGSLGSDVLIVKATPSVDLAVIKTDDPDPVLAGQNLTYTVTVTNKGPDVATGVTLTDTLPGNVTLISATPSQGTSCTLIGVQVICNLGTLNAGASATATLEVTAPSVATTLTNTVTVTGIEPDSNGANNTTSQTTTVNPAADLSITKTDNPDPVLTGQTLTYTLTVLNQGPSGATNVTVTDTLPGNVTFVSATPSQGTGCTQAGGKVTCGLGAIASGNTATLTILLIPQAGGSLTNTATVAAAEADPDGNNNKVTQDTTVTPVANLSITQSDTPDPVLAGQKLTYLLTVGNGGPDPATGVTMVDTLPGSVTFISTTPTQGSCGNTGSTVTCNLGTLAKGATATVTILVTAPLTAMNLTNTVTVTGNEIDSNGTNNTMAGSTTVNPAADLSITQTDTPDPLFAGQNLAYLLQVTNNGPSSATGVTVTDTLPGGVTFLSATPSQGSCSGTGTLTCNLGTLVNGVTATITISVTVPLTAGTLTNTATVTGSPADPNSANNTSAETTSVNAADLSLKKVGFPDPVFAGENLTYLLTVTNNGPSTATGITLSDTLPLGVTFVSANASQGTGCNLTGGKVNCSLGSLTSGSTATVTILAAAPLIAGTLTNMATVTANEPDLTSSNNTATVTTAISPPPTPTPTPIPTPTATPTPIPAPTLTPTPLPTPNITSIPWGIKGDIPVPGDYNGDKKADPTVWRPGEGDWFILLDPPIVQPWGTQGDKLVPGEYDGDGKEDIAVFRPSTGTWFILGSSSGPLVRTFGTSGDIPVPADYDGDGITDLAIFRPSLGIWIISPSNSPGGPVPVPQPNNLIQIPWGIAGDTPVPADYDGDGKADVAVWRASDGTWYINFSSGGFDTVTLGLPTLPGDTPVPADYDGDGKIDIAIWRPGNGTWYFTLSSTGLLNSRPWGLFGDIPVPADYDGDGRADLAVWRPVDGTWNIIFDNTVTPPLTPTPTPTPNPSTPEPMVVFWGIQGDIPIPRDYNGDKKDDLAVWRPGEGNWFILLDPPVIQPWGTKGDKLVPGDYDGDGKEDIAVFRPSVGAWIILGSSSGPLIRVFGTSTDTPVPADYDGDKITDLAIFRPSLGVWVINLSSNPGGSGSGNLLQVVWGIAGDIPVPGDYDGDGKEDVAVWRPGDGNWYINFSSGGFTIFPLGLPVLPDDIPVPADYDGDGKTDIAIWRPGDGTWHITFSSTGLFGTKQWGLFNDVPVPADYNGDGKADLAVWRPSDGSWNITFDK